MPELRWLVAACSLSRRAYLHPSICAATQPMAIGPKAITLRDSFMQSGSNCPRRALERTSNQYSSVIPQTLCLAASFARARSCCETRRVPNEKHSVPILLVAGPAIQAALPPPPMRYWQRRCTLSSIASRFASASPWVCRQ